MKKLLRSPKALLIIFVLLIVAGGFLYLRGQSSSRSLAKAEHPEYLNFNGNYVFSVPKSYSIDEQALPGIVLVYSGAQSGKTLEDVYSAGGISAQQLKELPDKSTKKFKEYVNKTFVEELKKNLSTQDVEVKFGKISGQDFAEASVMKDGKQIRFVYLKNGTYPIAVASKTQTDEVKKIANTLADVPTSDLKDEAEKIKQVLQSTYQLVKDQKVAELYNGATDEFRANSKQADVDKAVKDVSYFSKDVVAITGITYAPGEFTAALRYSSTTNTEAKTAYGAIVMKKVDGGEWKLVQMSLPTQASAKR